MASHEELLLEMPKLEKMSNAARLKVAKKRRQKQLRNYVETERALVMSGSVPKKKRSPVKLNFEDSALLHEAVQRNNLQEVECLVKRGVSCNHSNADGLTPLHRCCIENTVDMAKLLIEHNGDLCARDIEGWTPLHAASACGNLAMINLLIDSGANLVAVNHDDKMPVDVACDSDIRYVIQQKMLEAGYTDDVCKYIRDSVPKTMLADLKEAITNGEPLTNKDRYGATALHIAAANGYTEVLEFLLTQPDININVQDNEGWTPFHAAVCWEQRDAMKLLAEKGADLEKQDIHGDTPFAVSDVPEIRQYIIDLKQQFTAPQSLALPSSSSRDDLGESIGKSRSLSVRRQSIVDREDLKKMSSREEKIYRQETMEAEDVERTASGETIDDELILADIELSLNSAGAGSPPSSSAPVKKDSKFPFDADEGSLPPRHLETSIEDGMLEREVESQLNERKEVVSILKNKNPTPVKKDSLLRLEEEVEPGEGSRNRRNGQPSNFNKDCCIIL